MVHFCYPASLSCEFFSLDSEVPDIKAKKLKTMQAEETIVEEDEESEETGTSSKKVGVRRFSK